jgi:hypothetical protein
MLQYHVLRGSGVYGMNSDFNNVLDDIRDTISTFDFNSLAIKCTIPSKAQHVLVSVRFGKIVHNMEVDFDMTTKQKIVFWCLKMPHGRIFFLAILIDELNQHMFPLEYCTILRYCLVIPLFHIDKVFCIFRKTYFFFYQIVRYT